MVVMMHSVIVANYKGNLFLLKVIWQPPRMLVVY